MNKKKFEIFTKENNKNVPVNMIFVKDSTGWLFLVNENAVWLVNSTNDFKDDPNNDKAIKAIVKQIKINKKIATPNA